MPRIPQAPANAHRFPYRVSYSETDAMRRVYYANYLIWLERGRVEMLRALGFAYKDLEEAHILLPVRQCELRYMGYATYDDEVEIITWIGEARRARVSFLSNIHRKGEPDPIVHGHVELACVTPAGRPQPFPPALAVAMQGALGAETV